MTEPWAGGSVPGREAEGRVSADPEAWNNNRDRMADGEPVGDDRRLTELERYGIQFNVGPDTIA